MVLFDGASSAANLYYTQQHVDVLGIRRVEVVYTVSNVATPYTYVYEGEPSGSHADGSGLVSISFNTSEPVMLIVSANKPFPGINVTINKVTAMVAS